MSIDETQARRFHEVYSKHFKVFFPLSQQFPTWEQLSERERALLIATCKELATDEAETLLKFVQIVQRYDQFLMEEVIFPIETRLKELGYSLCSKWDTEQRAYHYYVSITDPVLTSFPLVVPEKENTNNA